MKSLNRKDQTYATNKLPRVSAKVLYNKKEILYTGTIIRRRIKGPIKIYWHYAFVYGYHKQKGVLMIENNEDGVECVTWRDFLAGEKEWELFHPIVKSGGHQEIIQRAKDRSKFQYDRDNNNCEHFVNYCIFKKLESVQVSNTKMSVNALLMLLEGKLVNTPDKSASALLEHLNKFREQVNLKRGIKEWDEVIDEKIRAGRK